MYGIYIYIYLDEWLIFMVNVGKYTIHGNGIPFFSKATYIYK